MNQGSVASDLLALTDTLMAAPHRGEDLKRVAMKRGSHEKGTGKSQAKAAGHEHRLAIPKGPDQSRKPANGTRPFQPWALAAFFPCPA